MGNIVLLDDLTINKIAAGEVIERPASVIKEMVENSIDAGAKNITVEIRNGGISLIRITDDGCGIAEDDMEIAFERHATSKIRSADDLETVKSMGFRGEALASIAAIANVEMVSRKDGEDSGHRLVIEGGKILEKSDAARSVGTTITVEKLFFNTPVRYKFLKKDYTEAGYIEDAITRIALINKNVSIKLINNGKTIIQTNGNGDFKTVVYSIYGKDVASEIIEIDYAYEDMRVSGVIGKPVIARANRTNQLFFVNGRYIKDKNLSAAAEQGYKGMIPIGRYGFLILNLEINPKMVDVNVHPAKLEVRFEEENKVFKAIYHAIKSGLAKSELIEDINKSDSANSEKKYEISETKIEPTLSENLEDKKGISSLFKKILRDSNDNNEEKSVNAVEEIYKSRKESEEVGLNTEPLLTIQKLAENDQERLKDNEVKTINDGIVLKSVNLNNVPISSETREIDVSVVNDLIKENTASPKTISVDSEEINEKIKTEEKKENAGQNIIDNSAFEVAASKLVEAKLSLDSTQTIDTAKVREYLKDENNESNPEFDKMYKQTFGVDTVSVRKEKENENLEKQKMNVSNDFSYASENLNVFENEENIPEIKYKFLGIAFNTYIIIEIKDELYMIDQHAAHERIMYEKVKENYYSEEVKQEQYLLLPDIITVTHKEMAIAKENERMFARAGFSFEEFGENTIKLTSVPSMCEELNTKQLFLDILDEIDTVAVTARKEKEDKFIATVACKAAVKGKMKLDEREVHSLIAKLLELPNPFTCPHGRPTAIKMTKYDMERKFSRK